MQPEAVRTDEKAVYVPHSDGPSLAAHAGIHHRHMHRASWKIPATGHQGERADANVARWNLVRDVHHVRTRVDAENNGLHRPQPCTRHSAIPPPDLFPSGLLPHSASGSSNSVGDCCGAVNPNASTPRRGPTTQAATSTS